MFCAYIYTIVFFVFYPLLQALIITSCAWITFLNAYNISFSYLAPVYLPGTSFLSGFVIAVKARGTLLLLL